GAVAAGAAEDTAGGALVAGAAAGPPPPPHAASDAASTVSSSPARIVAIPFRPLTDLTLRRSAHVPRRITFAVTGAGRDGPRRTSHPARSPPHVCSRRT